MMKIEFKQLISYCVLVLGFMLLTACGRENNYIHNSSETSSETGFIVTKAGMYDSMDTSAIITNLNKEEKTISFLNRDINKKYTLNYDGASKIYDKYGTSMSIEQIENGDVVDITFLKSKKLLNSITLSPEAWVYSDISSFSIDENAKSIIINGNGYSYDKELCIFSDGKAAELMDINLVDKISVAGVAGKAYSIKVEEGHGYLRLKNEDFFIGGWIEVGSKIIKTIDEDMIIAVPVGTYDVNLSKENTKGTKTVIINKNQETELDIGGMKVEDIITYGNIIIVTTPDSAEVYIDGKEVDNSLPIKLEYGIHQLIAKAEGFQTLTQYIKVGQENATLDITLEKDITPITPVPQITVTPEVPNTNTNMNNEKNITPKVTPALTSTVSSNSVETTYGSNKITISTPIDVEVYVDGKYIGIAPVNFTKESGKHEVTLRRDGYVTRSYTITVDDSKQDEKFSFSDLSSQ